MSETSFASRVVMVRPAAFGANPETAASNVFQAASTPAGALERARSESGALERALVAAGVDVLVLDEAREAVSGPACPDACFPNNWFTTHADGSLVLYPMESPIRRREARPEWIERIAAATGMQRVHDLRHFEALGQFLEGTGSLLLDRERRIAFAALSTRTCPEPLAAWCDLFGYRAVTFHSELRGRPIYHTNVMLALGPDVALVSLDAVPVTSERAVLARELEATGRELVLLSEADLVAFVGNALFLRTTSGAGVWALSQRARAALADRSATLERSGTVVAPSVDTIESVGGGGVRCMLAELFATDSSR